MIALLSIYIFSYSDYLLRKLFVQVLRKIKNTYFFFGLIETI